MKTILAIVLTLALALCLAVPAFADEATLSGNTLTKNITVSGTYVANPNDEVISVDVSWGAMSFTYTPANDGTWNPADHTYTNAPEATWTCAENANKITVTNHSNVDVTATFAFNATAQGITGTFTNTSLDLDAGVENKYNEADTDSTKFNITGGSIAADNNNLGTITVTIAKKAS